MLAPNDGTGRTFLVDQIGTIQILRADGTWLPTPFLDISDRLPPFSTEFLDIRGLLGLAFHPDFATNGRFFIFYTLPPHPDTEGVDHLNRLSEFRVRADDPHRADLASEKIILEFEQGEAPHAAGQLAFEPQTGYLFVGVGDALHGDIFSQTRDTYFGKILRLDVDSGDPYTIPPDNPFVGQTGKAEIYALGLRHPWRIFSDPATERIYIADPKWQAHHQTIFAIERGANYGWAVHPHPFTFDEGATTPRADSTHTPTGEPITPPLVEYGANIGHIVSGLCLYRGADFPDLYGKLIFTEWGVQVEDGAKVLAATPAAHPNWHFSALELVGQPDDAPLFWGLGTDAAGELYVLTMAGVLAHERSGKVYRLVAVG
jgi:glucose/arabinose dehydrogenase